MSKLNIQPLKYIQHMESVEVIFSYPDLKLATAQMICPLAKDVDGNYLSDEDMLIALEGCAPPREWFEMQEGRLSGAAQEVLKTLPSFVQAVAPILMPDNPAAWYEDLVVSEPVIIEGQWKRPAQIIDLRNDDNVQKLKTNLRAVIADLRYNHEVGGITVNGAVIKTDRESQATITGAYSRAQADSETTVAWKADNGFVELDCASIIAFGDAVFNHVQACFDHERVLETQVEAAQTWQDIMAIDLEAGWPVDVYGTANKGRMTVPALQEA